MFIQLERSNDKKNSWIIYLKQHIQQQRLYIWTYIAQLFQTKVTTIEALLRLIAIWLYQLFYLIAFRTVTHSHILYIVELVTTTGIRYEALRNLEQW